MKRKSLIFIVFIMFLLGFSGYKYIDFLYNNQTSNDIGPTLINLEGSKETNITTLEMKKEPSKKTDPIFFTSVFKNLSLGVSFEIAEHFVKSTGYTYVSEKAGENNITTIKIYENGIEEGDKINLIFMYNNKLERETLKGIFYVMPKKNKQFIIENLSDDNKEFYNQYRIQTLNENHPS